MDSITEPTSGTQPNPATEGKKLKCPFCAGVFPPQRSSRCPHCGKTIVIPLNLRPDSEEVKKRRRESVLKRNQLQREASGLRTRPTPAMFSKPVILFGAALLLLGIGGLLIQRTHQARSIAAPAPGQSGSGLYPMVTLEERARRNLGVLRTALEMFRHDCGRYPTTYESLRALVRPPTLPGVRPFYIDALKPDIWGNKYFYECVRNEIRLASNGPDGLRGTRDDIESPPPDLAILAQWQAATAASNATSATTTTIPPPGVRIHPATQ